METNPQLAKRDLWLTTLKVWSYGLGILALTLVGVFAVLAASTFPGRQVVNAQADTLPTLPPANNGDDSGQYVSPYQQYQPPQPPSQGVSGGGGGSGYVTSGGS